MARVRRGKVAVLLTYKLDRLARSLSHLAQILAELQVRGVALVCPSQGIDTSVSNPAAQSQLNILVAAAQFEREFIVERVRAVVKAATDKGVRLGRLADNPRHLPKVREFVAQGMTAAVINRERGIPYSSAGALVRAVEAERSTRQAEGQIRIRRRVRRVSSP